MYSCCKTFEADARTLYGILENLATLEQMKVIVNQVRLELLVWSAHYLTMIFKSQ